MRRAAVLAVTALSLVVAAPAGAATSVSENWAGYAASGRGARFAKVSATWTVSPVSCVRGRRTYSAAWIGIGGYHTEAAALEQAGTDATCDRAGGAHYSSWLEVVPAPSVRLPLTVHAGDRISATVAVSGHVVRVALANRTTGGRLTRAVYAPRVDLTSAEWIVEAPSACYGSRCTVLPLADFGTQGFTAAGAVSASGHAGAIRDAAWATTAIRLSSRARTDLGPGRFSGDAFDVTFDG